MFHSFSTPNININTGPARRGSEGPGISYPVPFIQGPVAEDGSQKFIQVGMDVLNFIQTKGELLFICTLLFALSSGHVGVHRISGPEKVYL